MGLSRDSRHKHRLTGGRRSIHQKKRKYELARPSAMTKLGSKRIADIRVRGGGHKYRALRLDMGNFSWGSETCTRKARVLDVVYNASNNELVRTKTLVKNAVIQVDATPFRMFYEQRYGGAIGKKKKDEATGPEKKASRQVIKRQAAANKDHGLEAHLKEQFATGRLYACISSRPGQSGRCDGYILEGKELEFYTRRMSKKK